MSWHYLQEQEAASWGANSLDGAPVALLSLMPTPGACCWLASETDTFPASRSGTKSAPSMASPGAVRSMSLVADSRARTSALPVVAPGSTESEAGSGASSPGSLARWDRDSRSWKTHQRLLLGGWESYSETWPRWGMMLAGECWELQMPELHICESESGLWPTPTVHGNHNQPGASAKAGWGLSSAAKLWRTPNTVDAKGGTRTGKGQVQLCHQVKMWPTPNVPNGGRSVKHVTDWRGKSGYHNGKKVQVGLESAVRMLPTPTAADTGHRTKPYAQVGTPLSMEAGGSLNPTWVEWLMGWPLGWTDLKALETAKFQQWQRLHGVP